MRAWTVSYTHLTLPTTSRRQRQMCIRDRAIIDNYISKNEVANLIGKDITVIDAHGNSIKEYKWAEMTHGTVCTSILAENLKMQILRQFLYGTHIWKSL